MSRSKELKEDQFFLDPAESSIENLAVSSLGLMAERIQIRKQNPASWSSMNERPYQDSIMF